MKYFLFLLITSVAFVSCGKIPKTVTLSSGLQINHTVLIDSNVYNLPAPDDSLQEAVITIEGENIDLDFKGAILNGAGPEMMPNQFTGLGVLIKNSKNVTIRNLVAKGYKVALMAQNVDSLQIIDCDFSYNYRQKLYSMREREDLSDWLSYHDNEKDEWLRYGAGIYLKSCDHALVKSVKITGGQNGLMLTSCNDGLFYNNQIQFNSGVGLGLYRSSNNRIMHNQLDWNVRGYSHGFYRRGQDSAGILCYEQSSNNVFAYNSATHSGDGFFLWAGNTTMDTGEGGCNGNMLYGNDFSHAPTNGIEVTFSSNKMVNNRLEECNYGIWGGYSWNTLIAGNYIADNDYGIAIEHGQDNTIQSNYFENNRTGVRLWARASQPADWGYAQTRDVRSRDYLIEENIFAEVPVPLQISSTERAGVRNNGFFAAEKVLEEQQPNVELVMNQNVMLEEKPENPLLNPNFDFSKFVEVPAALLDGIDAMLPEQHPRGRSFILVGEWGPYDFRYPSIWLREIKKDSTYVFLLLGPVGNWKVVDGNGFQAINPKTGAFPVTLTAKKQPGAKKLALKFEFVGQAFMDPFGNAVPKGQVYPFHFQRLEQKMNWEVNWYAYKDSIDPVKNYEAFKKLKEQQPVAQTNTNALNYRWWGSPAPNVPNDQFATFANATATVEPGKYKLLVTSDDGIRLFVDGEQVLDRWNIHEPVTDEIELELGGTHHFEIEHFENGGLATLDFRLEIGDYSVTAHSPSTNQ